MTRNDQATFDEARGTSGLTTRRDRGASHHSKKEEQLPYPPWTAGVFETFRKVFNAAAFTLEQEKRLKRELGRARTLEDALDAIDLLYAEDVRYPMGGDVRRAVERVNRRAEDQRELDYGPGPFISFRDWYATQDAEMQARVRRVFPSLEARL